MIKITETTERWCCQEKDLKPIQFTRPIGSTNKAETVMWRGQPEWLFCQHCGRHHHHTTKIYKAGDSAWIYEPQPYPWDKK